MNIGKFDLPSKFYGFLIEKHTICRFFQEFALND